MSINSERPDGKSAASSSNQPGGLPLFTSGWGTGSIKFTDTATFWEKVDRLLSESQLASSLDEAMAGHSSPRVWLFLHEPGQSDLSMATALNFARELAHRDQSVLLLDGDDDKADLTRLAGRIDVDGWIDLVRYGSSVLNCGIPMPFSGRRGYLLGVGSFTPADVTALEVSDLLGRLKRQADDVLITAPADAVGRIWATEADIRLLCWDRAERSASLVNNLLESFQAVGIPLTGLVGFGLPRNDVDEEVIAPVATIEEVPDVVADDLPQDNPTDSSASDIISNLAEQEDEFVEEEEFARRKGNSGIFWLVVVVSIILISAAGGYYYKFVKVPAGGHFPVVAEGQISASEEDLIEEKSPGTIYSDNGISGYEVDSTTEKISDKPDHLVGQPTGKPGESLPENNDATNPDPNPDLAGAELAEIVDGPAKDQIEVDEPVAIDQEKIMAAEPESTIFRMAPYTSVVGSAGWTLHVYSFPDSVRANKECTILADKGFQSQTRAVHFKEKGRWFRIYVGSFSTKSEAAAASKSLKEKLGEDWANPVRF